MLRVDKTEYFVKWFKKLKDRRAQAIINEHVDNIEEGKLGDAKAISGGIYERRIHYGPGYRLYYCKLGQTWVLLLCGGDKSTQKRDVELAKKLKKGLK